MNREELGSDSQAGHHLVCPYAPDASIIVSLWLALSDTVYVLLMSDVRSHAAGCLDLWN